jgi:tetratricopeptide (TPR) repeat protein
MPKTAVLLICVATMFASCSGDPAKRKREYVESGDRYTAAGKHKEAVIEYRNAVRLDPLFGEARLKLGDGFAASDDPTRAFREYIRAADLMPKSREAQMKAGASLLLVGRFEEAKARAEKVLEVNPKDADAVLLRAQAFAGLKQFDAAIKEIEDAITLDPTEPRRRAALGTVYLSHGDAKRAEESYRQALELKPNDAHVLLALGTFYWSNGRLADAEQGLKQAHTAAPDDVSVNRALATFYASHGQGALAEPFMKKLAAITTEPRVRLALADYYVLLDRPKEALQYLEPLRNDAEFSGEARTRMATIDYAAGRRKEAFAAIDEILTKDARNVRARLLKARLLVDSSRGDDAMAEVMKCLEINRDSVEAQYFYGVMLEARGDRERARHAFNAVLGLNPHAVQAQTRLAEMNLADGALDLAVQYASQALKGDPASDQARITLTRALIGRRDLASAKPEVALLIKRYPKSATVQVLAGLLAAQQGNRADARAAFERALELNPKSPEAYAGLLALDAASHRIGESHARLERTIAQAPSDAPLLLVAARGYGMDKQWSKSEALLKRVLTLDPDNLTAYTMLGSLYIEQGKLPEAQQEFEHMAQRRPNSLSAAVMVGTLLHIQNKIEETKVWYERALEIDPNAVVPANNLAWLYSDSPADIDKGLQLAKSAAQRAPENAEVVDTLGWVHYKKGQYTLAIVPLKRCIELDPSNPVYLYHLGMAYARAGQKNEARLVLERALKLRADFDGADEARRALSAL